MQRTSLHRGAQGSCFVCMPCHVDGVVIRFWANDWHISFGRTSVSVEFAPTWQHLGQLLATPPGAKVCRRLGAACRSGDQRPQPVQKCGRPPELARVGFSGRSGGVASVTSPKQAGSACPSLGQSRGRAGHLKRSWRQVMHRGEIAFDSGHTEAPPRCRCVCVCVCVTARAAPCSLPALAQARQMATGDEARLRLCVRWPRSARGLETHRSSDDRPESPGARWRLPECSDGSASGDLVSKIRAPEAFEEKSAGHAHRARGGAELQLPSQSSVLAHRRAKHHGHQRE